VSRRVRLPECFPNSILIANTKVSPSEERGVRQVAQLPILKLCLFLSVVLLFIISLKILLIPLDRLLGKEGGDGGGESYESVGFWELGVKSLMINLLRALVA
jgi:hypothetical protein